MDWDPLDEEIRQALDGISLEDLDTSSVGSSPSPLPDPLYPAEMSDVASLFRGYLEVTGGAENVDKVLNEVKELLLTSPLDTSGVHDPVALSTGLEGHEPVTLSIDDFEAENNSVYSTSKDEERKSLESFTQPVTTSGEVSNAAGGELTDSLRCGVLDPLVESACGWEQEQLLVEQQLSQEQLQKELELNALIEENQQKFEERERIVNDRERAKAAVRLQAYFKGHLTRLWYRKISILKNKIATLIQSVWRGHQARKKRKAMLRGIVVIQKTWRNYRYRQRRLNAAMCIQKHWRARKLAKEKQQLVKRMKAAVVVQRAWRRYRHKITASRRANEDTQEDCQMVQVDEVKKISVENETHAIEEDPSVQLQQIDKPKQSISNYLQPKESQYVNAEHYRAPLSESVDAPPPYIQPTEKPLPTQSPNKLTISKRIQTALRHVKQSSSTHQLEAASKNSPRTLRSYSLPATMKKSLCGTDWSQLQVDKNILASVLTSHQSTALSENHSLQSHAQNTPQNKETEPVKCEDGTKQVELKRPVPMQNKQLEPPPIPPRSNQDLQSLTEPKQQSQEELLSDVASVESESVALVRLREGRQREMRAAEQSRVRMSTLISQEELQQVATQKRANDTYRNELEFAAQPLSARAWCGLVSERLEEWKKRHRKWTPPTPHTPSTQPSHPHPPHTGTPLTNAQLVAASPKGTPPEQVAMVIMYRSRSQVDLKSLAKCVQLASLSLTKCSLVSLSTLEGCSQLKEVKVQSNSIEHLDLCGTSGLGFVDLSDNRLASIHGLQSCTELLTLDLSENRLARLAGLDGCHHLQKLIVDSNLIINSKGLANLALLQWFSCSENHLPQVEGLDGCSLLQHLSLSQNNLQRAPLLCDHVLLRELSLDGNSLSDMAPLSKAWLPLLQTLSLANNCITELASLACMVMLETLDVSNNSLYDLPVLLQCVRGCYQLRGLVVSGNPVSEEPKLRHYIIKALPCLEVLDDKPLRTKVEVPTVVSSSSVYILCKRQIAEQAANKPTAEQAEGGDGPPSPHSVVQALKHKVARCNKYQALLIHHLREHECLEMRDGPPPSPPRCQKQLPQTAAAVRIQAVWRGFICRRWVETLRQNYHRAATVIQAHYRGYRLRTKLRMVLESVRFTNNGEGTGSEDEIDFEEEIVVDYLDESALDIELGPLSSREPLPSRRRVYSRTSPLSLETEPTNQPAMMMPVYTLPGCMETEVTLDEWRRQQREDHREPVKESVRESFGAPLVSEDGDSVRKNPLAAWENTSEVDDRVQGSIAMADKIANEWGLQNTSTAELMMKRAKRQKKLQTKANQRKKLEDPSQRLAAFRRKAPPTHVLRAQEDLYGGHSPAAQSTSPQSNHQRDLTYQWVNNHTLVHKRDPLYKNIQRGSSLLPPMEPRVLAGHAPQLVMTTSARDQATQFSSGQACNSYPSMRHKLNVKTHSTSNM